MISGPVAGVADLTSAPAVTTPPPNDEQVEFMRPLRFANLELRFDEMQALVDGTRVGLTVREFQVLAVLASHEDRVVRREEIYRRVWGGEMKHRDRAVDVFVRKLRSKLVAAAPGWAYIHTHFGIGYRFAPEPVARASDTVAPPDGASATREDAGPASGSQLAALAR